MTKENFTFVCIFRSYPFQIKGHNYFGLGDAFLSTVVVSSYSSANKYLGNTC